MDKTLDEQVALVQGWKKVNISTRLRSKLWDWQDSYSNGKCSVLGYHPSEYISQAWILVEQARKKGFVLSLYQAVPSDKWVATFYVHCAMRKSAQPEGYFVRASSAPEAICLAFVKAMARDSPTTEAP